MVTYERYLFPGTFNVVPGLVKSSDGAFVQESDPVVQRWLADGNAISEPVIDLLSYSASKRWAKETGGITVSGMAVRTDERTRSAVTSARADAQAVGVGWSTYWKLADGTFVQLNGATIEAIALAISAHVQACFRVEAEVAGKIATGKIKTVAKVDEAYAAI